MAIPRSLRFSRRACVAFCAVLCILSTAFRALFRARKVSSTAFIGSFRSQRPLFSFEDQIGLKAQIRITQGGRGLSTEDQRVSGISLGDKPIAEVELRLGVVVTGKMEGEDTAWLRDLPEGWDHAVYLVDNRSAPLHTPMNKGREAMPYLTYIIDHYDKLPPNVVFLHSHAGGYPDGWHIDAPDHSNLWSIQHLNLDFVQRSGYTSLRCIYIPGCPSEIQIRRDEKDYDNERQQEQEFVAAWSALFQNDNVPEVIGTACCAQFAVSRDQLLKRRLREYIRFRQWLIDTELPDEVSGRVFEYLWHIIFGKNPIHCPELERCYNDVYNGDQQPPEGFGNPEWVHTMIHE